MLPLLLRIQLLPSHYTAAGIATANNASSTGWKPASSRVPLQCTTPPVNKHSCDTFGLISILHVGPPPTPTLWRARGRQGRSHGFALCLGDVLPTTPGRPKGQPRLIRPSASRITPSQTHEKQAGNPHDDMFTNAPRVDWKPF